MTGTRYEWSTDLSDIHYLYTLLHGLLGLRACEATARIASQTHSSLSLRESFFLELKKKYNENYDFPNCALYSLKEIWHFWTRKKSQVYFSVDSG